MARPKAKSPAPRRSGTPSGRSSQQDLYHHLCEESRNEIYLFDARTLRFIHVNRGARENLGYTLQELRRLTPLDLKPEYSRRSFARLIEPLKRGRVPHLVFETVHRRKDGSCYPVEVHLELHRSRRRAAFVAVIVDLTERRRAEQEVRVAHEKFWRLVEFAPDPTVLVDAEGRLAYVNRQAARLFGYQAAELLGQPIEILVPEDLRAVHAEHRRRYASEPAHRPMGIGLDLQGRRADGTTFPVDVSLAPLDTPDGQFVAAAIRDVTAQRRVQDELRRSEQRYRSLVRGAVYGIYRSTVEGRLLEVNPALVEILGYDSEAQVLNLDLARDVYVDPGERQRLIAEWSGGGAFRNVEAHWRRKDGSVITVLLSGRSVLDERGAVREFEVLVEDVTEQRRFEQHVQQIQRLETVGRLVGGVAHDFNNLLTVILGSTELLLETVPEGDARRSEVVEIREAAARAAALTKQLLAFSRQQPWHARVLDPNQLVASIERMARRVIGEDVELVVSLAQGVPAVKADPSQLEQVLMNLIVNARDAMPRGGRLAIATARYDVAAGEAARHPVVPPGHYATISVADTGCGMDEETRSYAFEPFFTTKEPGKGTGLGLSTVHGIVQQAGGHVWIDSEPGRGTTVTVYLPVADRDAEPEEQATGVERASPGWETILLLEDDDPVRKAARRILEHHGYTVLEARSGPEAVALAQQHQGPIHLLLADVVMPEMGGRRSAEHLAMLRPEMKVLYMSGYPERGPREEQAPEPDAPFLAKPFTVYSLGAKVREVLDQR